MEGDIIPFHLNPLAIFCPEKCRFKPPTIFCIHKGLEWLGVSAPGFGLGAWHGGGEHDVSSQPTDNSALTRGRNFSGSPPRVKTLQKLRQLFNSGHCATIFIPRHQKYVEKWPFGPLFGALDHYFAYF